MGFSKGKVQPISRIKTNHAILGQPSAKVRADSLFIDTPLARLEDILEM